jgi:hypothetical protein
MGGVTDEIRQNVKERSSVVRNDEGCFEGLLSLVMSLVLMMHLGWNGTS